MVLNIIKKERSPQYLFFSGKGGVGKTSCAAANAVNFARDGKKTLIISTDPAHSLSDSFDFKIGGELTKIDKNLYAVEIDPKKAVEEYKEKFSSYMEKFDFLKGFGLDDTFDVAEMAPGIDELAAFDKFLQYMQNKEYDIIIFDTAPTGHALRFLSLPDVLDSWIGKLIKIRMRLSGITGIFKKLLPFNEDQEEEQIKSGQLESIKERISEAKSILSDPEKTKYNLVMIPESLSILETERLLNTLHEYGIPVDTIIVNQLIPDNKSCNFCSERRKMQQSKLKEIKKKFKDFKILEIKQFKEEVRGSVMLKKMLSNQP